MADQRGDWQALVWQALRTSVYAVELAALSEDELPPLVEYLESGVELPYHAVRHMIADSVQLVVHISRRAGVRVVSEMSAVRRYDADRDRYEMDEVVR